MRSVRAPLPQRFTKMLLCLCYLSQRLNTVKDLSVKEEAGEQTSESENATITKMCILMSMEAVSVHVRCKFLDWCIGARVAAHTNARV